MYCTKCGNPMTENELYCTRCGARSENQAATVTPVYSNETPASTQKYGQNNIPRNRCPKCGSESLQMINDMKTSGKDFSGTKGCCGAILLGPIGLLCGACGKGKQVETTHIWVCNYCGNRWKA